MPKVRAQRRGESERCPLCKDRFSEEASFFCECGVRYHTACISELGGTCVPGCERELKPAGREEPRGILSPELEPAEMQALRGAHSPPRARVANLVFGGVIAGGTMAVIVPQLALEGRIAMPSCGLSTRQLGDRRWSCASHHHQLPNERIKSRDGSRMCGSLKRSVEAWG
jgi:hypothetical protein